MTPEEEMVVRAIMERDNPSDRVSQVRQHAIKNRARSASDAKLRMQFLDNFMGMPPDAPRVPPMQPGAQLPPMPIPGPQPIVPGATIDQSPMTNGMIRTVR